MPCHIEVVVLTHERASAEEIIPYLAQIFWPMPIVSLFGRCGAEEPRINKESCVYYGWKEPRYVRLEASRLHFSV